ncbi:MAG: ATP-dependent helicase, partial [Alphaproteobacteria bacterium]
MEFDTTFLETLNPEQYQAVTTTEGPLLVLSGAGTGKTRVLTTRIAYILANGLAHPWQVLAVTFTNKAAKEMQERLTQMVGAMANDVWLGTFHRIGLRILRRYGNLMNLDKNFIVLDADDQERLLKNMMKECQVDTKQYPPADLLEIIQHWKDRGLAPEAVTEAQNSSFCEGRALDFYKLYQKRLTEMNAVDFGDLLMLPLILFQTFPDVLAEYQHRFQYILVDEYQDTNIAQYMLLRLLAKGTGNICCVGDDDQSIYSWRGANVDNLLGFEKVFPGAQIIRLETNYRSTEHILASASALIANNAGRLGKTLRVADANEAGGELVVVQGYYNGLEEASEIIQKIEDENHAGTPLSKMAVLVRLSFLTREFEDALVKANLPYRIIGGFKFYEREEIRDVVAYLRLVVNQGDDLAFMRVVNKPRRGIGDKVAATLQQTAAERHISLFEAINYAPIKPAPLKALQAFRELILDAQKQTATLKPSAIAKNLLQLTGYIAMWQAEKSLKSDERVDNIYELLNKLEDYATLDAFIEEVSLQTESDEQTTGDQLVVMTLHASKGLEFDKVFLPAWEEEIFPHKKALDEKGEAALEEERRLAYVGITRAKKSVHISYASNRRVYGQ